MAVSWQIVAELEVAWARDPETRLPVRIVPWTRAEIEPGGYREAPRVPALPEVDAVLARQIEEEVGTTHAGQVSAVDAVRTVRQVSAATLWTLALIFVSIGAGGLWLFVSPFFNKGGFGTA